ncbi:MAG: hypothetical protein R3E65_10500 [Steroidobacteraceae bacterium]
MNDAPQPMAPPDFNALRRLWRDATREWLSARNAVARLQDATVVDPNRAVAAARRLEHAERRRQAVNRQVEAALEATNEAGNPIG